MMHGIRGRSAAVVRLDMADRVGTLDAFAYAAARPRASYTRGRSAQAAEGDHRRMQLAIAQCRMRVAG
jgi:hypothetical protein